MMQAGVAEAGPRGTPDGVEQCGCKQLSFPITRPASTRAGLQAFSSSQGRQSLQVGRVPTQQTQGGSRHLHRRKPAVGPSTVVNLSFSRLWVEKGRRRVAPGTRSKSMQAGVAGEMQGGSAVAEQLCGERTAQSLSPATFQWCCADPAARHLAVQAAGHREGRII